MALKGAVPARTREFTTGRACARRALRTLGVHPQPAIPMQSDRSPRWPAGVVGSITHCEGFCAAAVAWRRDLRGLGIDATPATPLPAGVPLLVCTPEESARGGGPLRETMIFSAKESVLKCVHPLTGRRFTFHDVDVTLRSPGRFAVTGAPVEGLSLHGRYAVTGDLVLTTAVARR